VSPAVAIFGRWVVTLDVDQLVAKRQGGSAEVYVDDDGDLVLEGQCISSLPGEMVRLLFANYDDRKRSADAATDRINGDGDPEESLAHRREPAGSYSERAHAWESES
jgi:hypothetical protein